LTGPALRFSETGYELKKIELPAAPTVAAAPKLEQVVLADGEVVTVTSNGEIVTAEWSRPW
jgi:hypothetical protein